MTRIGQRLVAGLVAVTLGLALAGGAQGAVPNLGTPDQAKALLKRAVAALRSDQAAALVSFNRPDGGFRDRDLYVFCAGPEATTTAHAVPTEIGRSFAELADAKGRRFGAEILAVATEGRVDTVDYAWPLPGGSEPVAKRSFVTRVGGQACGVGYYRP